MDSINPTISTLNQYIKVVLQSSMNFLEIDRKQKDVVMKIEEEKTSKNKIDSKLDFENLSDGINYIGYMQKLQT